MTKREREERSQMCAPERGGRFRDRGQKRRHKQREHRTEKEEKKKRCVQQLVLYLNARYNGEGKCTEEEEEEEASRERKREREGGRWRLEERRPALRTERRRRR